MATAVTFGLALDPPAPISISKLSLHPGLAMDMVAMATCNKDCLLFLDRVRMLVDPLGISTVPHPLSLNDALTAMLDPLGTSMDRVRPPIP